MPENQRVSVAWQIVFTFLPIVNFWAFYRIRKLRKYLLYVILPSVVASVILVSYVTGGVWVTKDFSSGDFDARNEMWWQTGIPSMIIGYAVSFALQGFAIYLVIIWSRQHNRSFDV